MTKSGKSDSDNIRLLKPSQLKVTRRLSSRGLKAKKIINKYSLLAGSVGLVPMPLFNQIAVSGLLIKLLQEMCEVYGLSISDHKSKIIVSSILGGAHSEWVSHYLLKYMKSYMPSITSAGSILLRPATSGLIVFYIGNLFLGHLESGAWIRVKEQGLRQFG